MKKFLTLALCISAIGSISAQKQIVDQASKLAGKNEKIAEARQLINQAIANPETASDARTYFTGGKIEFDAFDNSFKRQMINPQDKSVNPIEMAQQLLNGYELFIKALPLDSLPDAKGKIKPKYSKDIYNKLNGHHNDYFNAGGNFYNNKQYYPEAYNAFMIYASMPKQSYATKEMSAIPDSVLNMAYFNAGISAYAGNNLIEAAKAFRGARLNNSENPQNFIYELACWQYIANQDSTKLDQAKKQIVEIANAGYNKFGMTQPIFLNNLINSLVMDDKNQQALQTVEAALEKNPDNATLYGLLGYVNDRLGNDDASVEAYRKAASIPTVDFETLKNACKKIFKVGTQKWNNIEGAPAAKRNEIKENYFIFAKKLTDQAKALNADDNDLNYVIENIDYALETFFN